MQENERRASDFAQRLAAWQRREGRHGLPWQRTNDPYLRWLSEIMLQQTQVAAVIPYFERFSERFPTVRDLARADEDEVMALWAGLGYYSRARNLLAAARRVEEAFGGVMPSDFEGLLSLPGVGESTAAAISAFVSGERRPMTDGNAKRVLARVFLIGGRIGSAAFERSLRERAERELPPSADMAAYTQGLMDLGATLCRRTSPECGRCPFEPDCAAHAAGVELLYPEPKKPVAKRTLRVAMAFVRTPRGVWLRRRTEKDIWQGLWTPPTEVSEEASRDAFALRTVAAFGLDESKLVRTGGMRHVLTHRELLIEARLYEADARSEALLESAGFAPFPDGDWPGVPVPVSRLWEEMRLFGALQTV